MFSIQCPRCSAKLNVPESAIGKSGRCPKCKQKFLVEVPAAQGDELVLLEESPAPLDDSVPLGATPAPPDELRLQPLPPSAVPLAQPKNLVRPTSAGPVTNPNKQKAASASLGKTQKIALVVGGGILLSLTFVAVIGGLLYVFFPSGKPVGGGTSWSGNYAVVDSMDSPPAEPAAESAPPLDVEVVAANKDSQAGWSVKPDPPSGEETSAAELVGALSPEPSLLLASLGGPFAVGVAPEPERGRRDKVLKRPDGSPGEVISIDQEPHPVFDLGTGKPVGRFPVAARIRFNCRLSPDGRYLASSEFEAEQGAINRRIMKDELVVWQRDADQPVCRWPLPGPVLWMDFIGPDRLALYHVNPGPEFVVLDVSKGTPVVTAPLPGEEFHTKHDAFSTRKAYTSYRLWAPSGAVSPGRKWIALGGSTSIVLVDTAGRVAGKLSVAPVGGVRGYLAVSFNADGTQLRALTQHSEAIPVLRVWSLADGQVLHNKPCPFKLRDGENPYHESAPGPAILDGPENLLIVGHQLFDLASGNAFLELPYQPLRWAGPQHLLALGRPDQAANAKELSATADFVPQGKSLIVAALDREALAAKAPRPDPAAIAAAPGGPPAPAAGDRSKVTAIRLKPPATWAVKPGAAVARPTGPLPLWPHAFAETQAAVITEGLFWIRYDLNTGAEIGSAINLWPDHPRSGEQKAWPAAALTRDGHKLALIDAKDRSRVDVWDITGQRQIGLRPYVDELILWHGWSADGKLLTASGGRLTAWDVNTGQAAFEVEGNFARFLTAPGAEWVIAMTPARHLFFLDTATGQCLGHIPASPSCPEHALSPDGKTLVRMGQGLSMQVWDLATGQRKSDRETPLVPPVLTIGGTMQGGVREPNLGVCWIGPRLILSHTKSPGEQSPRYYLYDLDAHTHTFRYPADLGVFQNDTLGRAWMTSRAGGSETWVVAGVPGAGTFKNTVAFGPGTTVRVEVDLGSRENSRQTAQKMAGSLAALGFKIGQDGWVLRGDHTTSTATTDLTDLRGQRGITVATLRIDWRLLDPQGNEAWKGTSGGKFDPFNSKYVVVGSRKTDMAPGGMGGGSTQVRLNYGGKDAMTAQVEEILEKNWYPGVPNCLVNSAGGYAVLPLEASPKSEPEP